MTEVPVALIFFNRPEETRQVFSVIREARPAHLFLIADGPRADVPGEAELVTGLREELVRSVDWPCKLETVFSETNLGCGLRPATGIDHVFSQCDRAIILEDDCVPHPDFFRWCGELLARYAEHPEVMVVSGQRYLGVSPSSEGDYFFSRYPYTWGWATWRRAWQHFDLFMKSWDQPEKKQDFANRFADDLRMAKVWSRRFDWAVNFRDPTIWDFQWFYACMIRGGLSVSPTRNLVKNIGYGPAATHTFTSKEFPSAPTEALRFPLRHPKRIERDVEADRQIAQRYFDYSETMYLLKQWSRPLRRKLGIGKKKE